MKNPRHFLVLGFLAVILLALFLSSDDVSKVNNLAQVSSPTYYAFDGFEGDSTTVRPSGFSWQLNAGSGDDLSVSSDIARTGSKSMKFKFEGSADFSNDSWSELRFNTGANLPEMYIRWYVYVPSGTEPWGGAAYYHRDDPNGPDNNKMFLTWAAEYSGSLGLQQEMYPDGAGGSTVRSNSNIHYINSSGTRIYQNITTTGDRMIDVSDRGKWIELMAHLKTSTSVTSNDAVYELWKNGKLIASKYNFRWFSDDLNPENFFRYGYLFGWAQTGFNETTYPFIDDVTISSSPIGSTPPPQSVPIANFNEPSGYTQLSNENFDNMIVAPIGPYFQKKFTSWIEDGTSPTSVGKKDLLWVTSNGTTPAPFGDFNTSEAIVGSTDGKVSAIQIPKGWYMPGGSGAPGTWVGWFGARPNVYAKFRIKLSSNYAHWNGNKFGYFSVNGTDGRLPVFIAMTPQGSYTTQTAAQTRPVKLKVGFQGVLPPTSGTGAGQTTWDAPANLGTSEQAYLTRGVWHDLEVQMIGNSSGKADGIFRMWLNGVKIMEYNNVGYFGGGNGPNATGFNAFRWTPTHDDFNDVPYEFSVYQFLDSAYFSGLAGTTAPAPTLSISASPSSITSGQSSTITWSTTNAVSCTATGGWSGAKSTSGTQSVTPTSNTTYSLTCTGSGGSATQSTSVSISSTPPPTGAPTLSISASPSSITSGGSSTITWSSTNTTSCNASNGWTGTKATSGTQSVSPTSNTTYNLSCTGSGGTTAQSTTVSVTSAPISHTKSLNYSLSSNRSNPLPLSGATLPINTPVYIFNTISPTTDVTQVSFKLNGGSSTLCSVGTTNPCTQVETSVPYDMAGTGTTVDVANPFQFTTSGSHSLSATQTYTSGSDSISASFSVSSPTTPPPTALFQIGDYVKTTSTLNVRSSGSINSSILGSQVGNSYGTVIGGPVIDGTYIWWQIDYVNAPDGWSSQTYLTEVTSLPTPPTGAPTLSISASPSSITSGGSSTITWSSTNTTSCNASNGWTGTKTTSGTQSVSPTSNTTYNLSCTGSGGTTAQSTSVSVTTPPPPTGNYSIGNWIEISTDKLNVRTGPSTLSGKAGFQYQGAKGILTNGPTSADGYTWWYVDFSSGSDGWAADSFFTLSSAPTPITTGSTVYTTERINVRSLPSTTSTRVGQQSANRPGTVIGGPTSAEGYTWWNVDFLSGADGWVAGEWLR